MMTLSEMAYRRRAVVYLVTVLLMGIGAVNYFTLPAREDPEITIREALVTTEYPGLSAERMELLVTKTLEEAVRQIPEVEEIRSVTQAGLSIIHVELRDSIFELDQVWDEVRAEVEAARAQLPDGTGPPRVFDDFGDVAVVTAALTADDFDMADMYDMAQHVRDLMYGVPGTKRVDLLGVQPERIYVEAKNARLAELGLDPQVLGAMLAEQNIIRPGGEVDTGERAFILEPSGNYDDLDAIGDTLIRLPGGNGAVPLRDLATVKHGYQDPPITKAYYNGRPAIVFAVAMVGHNSVLSYGARAKARLESIADTLPAGYQLDLITHQAEQVGKAVFGVSASVLQTVVIVLIVVILFLGLRTGLIVGSIVPAVMLASLGVMGFADMQLERMSLATLVIALGILVDNGIVVAEDFKRRLEEGISRDEALRQTGGELAFPLLASSLTTILVFLPLMLADHVSGEYTRSVSLVILITLSVSWVLALMLTPTLCHRFIRIDPDRAGSDGHSPILERLERGYGRLLRGILKQRALFLLVMGGLLVAAVAGMGVVPKKFFPASDRSQILVYIDLPAGVTTRTTDAAVNRLFGFLDDRERFPHIDDYAAYIGFGGPRFVLSLTPIDRASNKAFVMINVDRFDHMAPMVTGLRELFAREFPGLSAEVARMFLGPSDSAKLEVQVRGPDADHIYAIAGRMERLLESVPGAINVQQDWENRVSKLVVQVDQTRAWRAGITSADVARGLSRYFSGEAITDFRDGDDLVPIVVRGVDAERRDMDRVRSLAIYPANAPAGTAGVPLFQLADFELKNEFARIEREDMIRTITVEARNSVMNAEDMVPRLADGLARLRADLPPNHFIEYDGVVAESKEAQAALQANAPLCLGMILILLVTLFNSYRRPVIIMLTAPLIVIGVVIGLFVMRSTFGFMEILGIYALAGIIMNNAIVLINRFDIERADADKSDFDAIVSASMRRLRPILMTMGTTVIGLMPLIIGRDALFYGMSSVIAFGLAVGTILTLGVTPVLYSLFFRIRYQPRSQS